VVCTCGSRHACKPVIFPNLLLTYFYLCFYCLFQYFERKSTTIVTDIYVLSSCRTAIGKFGGAFKTTPATDLGIAVVKEAVTRACVPVDRVDEVVMGCVLSAGLGQNVARQVSVKAGIPESVPAITLNMVCGSGMRAVIEAARAIKAGDASIVIAGGTENMSMAPYVLADERWGARMGDKRVIDTMLSDGLTDAFSGNHMGITAENVADRFGVTREQMDEFSLRSQERAAAAIARGAFKDEIVPIPVKLKKQEILVDTDEAPRSTSLEALAKLRPAFKQDGRVTAGNSSGINDGAAALVLASGEIVDELGLKPVAKLVSWAQSGIDPSIMGVAPIEASRKALKRAGLTMDDIDFVEANEAFASQAVVVARELGVDESKLNVNGGAVALGHPVGASGARIIVTLLHEMGKHAQARYGLATLCVGGGMGVATIYERM
jgi:acetyl-CoA C-acetyltransferase